MMLLDGFIFGLLSLCLTARRIGGNGNCAASIRGACPSYWSQWGGNLYNVTSESLTWFEAKKECIKTGSVLVAPRSEEENAFLENLISRFWINCNDLENTGVWKCVDGSKAVSYRNWLDGQPSTSGGGGVEHCATMWTDGQWNDLQCDWLYPAVCKRPSPMLHL